MVRPSRPVIWMLVVAIGVGTWMWWSSGFMDAHAATPIRTSAMACVTNTGDPCPTAGRTYARKFRNDRYGTSKGAHFPRYVKRKIRVWYANHPNAPHVAARTPAGARVRTGDWWQWPLEELACAPSFGSGYRAHCNNGNDEHTIWVHGVRKVTVVCSGAAVIGTLGGGGAIGAGRAGGACMWMLLMREMFG